MTSSSSDKEVLLLFRTGLGILESLFTTKLEANPGDSARLEMESVMSDSFTKGQIPFMGIGQLVVRRKCFLRRGTVLSFEVILGRGILPKQNSFI